jgi:5-(carboxyamino)imidazole ribonucleotide mutase
LTLKIAIKHYLSCKSKKSSVKNYLYFWTENNINPMEPKVSIIMGSTSDLPVMEAAAKFLNEMQIPFEMNALSAHRTPEKVEDFAKKAYGRGIRVIIAAAGMAAHLPGVIAAMTTIPVIGVPIKASLEGLDSLLAIVQMPPGIPVATVGINGAQNAGILAAEILAVSDETLHAGLVKFKEDLKKKIIKANEELTQVRFEYKVG